jgi:hypothetical protein
VSDPRLHLLGIRHHGPGSAASVVAALDAINPGILLIEGPADANDVLPYAGRNGLQPPVAVLVYEADAPEKSVFYPFAEFSPEWQTLQWALKRRKIVRFADLPVSSRVGADTEEVEEERVIGDPLTMLAQAAGESDGEGWWNGLVEQSAGDAGIFASIEHAMSEVRAAHEEARPVSSIEAWREAFMRLEIAKALSETAGPVAMICGAWHVPALRRKVPLTEDRVLLKGLPKPKTLATWIPWTSSRLAQESGYGAGVTSPGWYQHLWSEQAASGQINAVAMTASWQTKVAGLLRDEGLPASTASVIEAARLAVSVASLRDHSMPGLAEMQDASLAVLCHGDDILLRLINRKLVIGDAIGEVGDDIPQMPLAEDLARWQKRLRLKPSASQEEMALDLRSETGFLKSILFHRLDLINVPWGRIRDAQAGRGTFREIWTIAWSPELSVRLAEALRFGVTIEQASGNAALDAASNGADLVRCAELVGQSLNADLGDAAAQLTARLQALAISEGDILKLMLSVGPLANILRYGTARKMPVEALTGLVTSMAAEISAGVAPACRGLNDEAAQAMFAAMRSFDVAVTLLEEARHREAWLAALAQVCNDTRASPFLRGYASRRLYDSQIVDSEETGRRLSLATSAAVAAAECGAWMEGFLSGAAQVLLHDTRLFGLVDDWLSGLSEDMLTELLPLLRRAVGSFDQMERRRLIEIVRKGPVSIERSGPVQSGDPEIAGRFAVMEPLLRTILGLKP